MSWVQRTTFGPERLLGGASRDFSWRLRAVLASLKRLNWFLAYGDALSAVITLSSSGGSSSKRKCCWFSSGTSENSIPVSCCVDIVINRCRHGVMMLSKNVLLVLYSRLSFDAKPTFSFRLVGPATADSLILARTTTPSVLSAFGDAALRVTVSHHTRYFLAHNDVLFTPATLTTDRLRPADLERRAD